MEISEDLIQRVARASRNLHRRFPMVELDDIQHECWAWILGHTDKISEWDSLGHFGKIQKSIWHCGLDFCQIEKARIVGYSNSDNYYYSTKVIEIVISELLSSIDPYDALSRYELVDKEAMIDVTAAFKASPKEDRDLLWGVLTCDADNPAEHMAREWGVTEDAVRGRYKRALRRLQRRLGGEAPKEHRRVQSNAAAVFKTKEEYEGR